MRRVLIYVLMRRHLPAVRHGMRLGLGESGRLLLLILWLVAMRLREPWRESPHHGCSHVGVVLRVHADAVHATVRRRTALLVMHLERRRLTQMHGRTAERGQACLWIDVVVVVTILSILQVAAAHHRR